MSRYLLWSGSGIFLFNESVWADLALTLVSMLDLGWDKWIIYPESFTFVRCGVCAPQQNQHVLTCRDDDPSALDPPSQVSPAEKPHGPHRTVFHGRATMFRRAMRLLLVPLVSGLGKQTSEIFWRCFVCQRIELAGDRCWSKDVSHRPVRRSPFWKRNVEKNGTEGC